MRPGHCIHCNLPKERHCPGYEEGEWKKPEGCKCDFASWGSQPGPICSAFVADKRDTNICRHCEHDYECHSAPTAAEGSPSK